MKVDNNGNVELTSKAKEFMKQFIDRNDKKAFFDIFSEEVQETIREELLRQQSAATFLKKALKIVIEEDANLSKLAAINKYEETNKHLKINGFHLWRNKNNLPSRLEDVYQELEIEYNNQVYVMYLEWTPANMESLFFPVFNNAYNGLFLMSKQGNEYVLYKICKSSQGGKTDNPLQQIFYGAPGTGKSNTIKEKVEDAKKKHHRTTFHPDSDYSTFVGAYKPTMSNGKKKQTILDYEALVDKLKEYIILQQQNITKACTLLGFDYHDSIVQMQTTPEHTIAQLVADGYKSGTTYDTQVRAGMSAYENSGLASDQEDQIVYKFVPQAFTKAYVEAWSTTEDVYLIIEEINRGNCAQIFGDIFQLLDRKNGFSIYSIDADDDLRDHIQKELAKSERTDIPEDVKSGKKLKLPSNLYIWATMNTSDQSLFPIDSAFKRRWEWKFMPIAEGKDKNTGDKLNWKIAVDGDHKYDWWKFIQQMNRVVGKATSSEDKKMGYFFCIADNKGEIGVETFVSKVVFYLWNDVFKDNGLDWNLDGKAVFKYKTLDDNGIEHDEDMTFPTFFLPAGKANPSQVINLMDNLNIENEVKKEEETE